MLEVVQQALPEHVIEYVYHIYRNSTNQVKLEQNSHTVDRHTISSVGKFLLSKFSQAEFTPVWESVKPHLEKSTGQSIELVFARVLKYNTSCVIPKHLDSNYEGQQSEISVIIQITDPHDYTGGEMIVSGQLIELLPGDMVFYTYDHEHEVKTVKSGIRYVINLRCKKVK